MPEDATRLRYLYFVQATESANVSANWPQGNAVPPLTVGSKAELQDELSRLRAQYESAGSPALTLPVDQSNPPLGQSIPDEFSVDAHSEPFLISQSSNDATRPDVSSPTPSPQRHGELDLEPPFISPPAESIQSLPWLAKSHEAHTISRKVGDADFSAQKINSCFSM